LKTILPVIIILIALVGCNRTSHFDELKLISPVSRSDFTSPAKYVADREGTAVEIYAEKGAEILAPRGGTFFYVEAGEKSLLGIGGYALYVVNTDYTVRMYILNGAVESNLANKEVMQGEKIGQAGDALPISRHGANLKMEIIRIDNNKEIIANIRQYEWWNSGQRP